VASSVDAQPTILDGEEIPAADLRRDLFGAVWPAAGVVSGLRPTALPTPDMKVRLPAGLCMVDDGAGGRIPLNLLAQVDLDVDPSSATLPRIDSVVAEAVDTGDPATLIRRFRVLTGTPASSPVAPALPPADQPTARTLRLANVFVQANAEVNGKVRPQDVSVTAPSTGVVPRPVMSLQVSFLENPSPAVDTWTDFSSGVWPTVSFTTPASGMAYITVGAETLTDAGVTEYMLVGYRLSGGATQAMSFGREVGGTGLIMGARRYLITGMTPGTTVTVTPQYRLSTTSGIQHVRTGSLLIEPVA
jgi:hypothetical protein